MIGSLWCGRHGTRGIRLLLAGLRSCDSRKRIDYRTIPAATSHKCNVYLTFGLCAFERVPIAG